MFGAGTPEKPLLFMKDVPDSWILVGTLIRAQGKSEGTLIRAQGKSDRTSRPEHDPIGDKQSPRQWSVKSTLAHNT